MRLDPRPSQRNRALSAKLLYLVVGSIALVLGLPTARADVEAQQVRVAIERAVNYLKREQNGGQWFDQTGQPGAVTALVTLALLNAGMTPEDDEIHRALTYLRGVQPSMTYAASLQTMVLAIAEPKKDLLLIRRNVKWLEAAQIKSGEKTGSWSYQANGGGDNSNTQFAILALHEAERAGVPVTPKTWRMALDYWQKYQNNDGSWGYQPGQAGTGSMTCAGIASVVISAGALNTGDASVVGGRVHCCGEQQSNASVENAISWLERNFTVHSNPGPRTQSWLLYYLYGVERVGRITNRRFIGKHDWYREGTDMLVRTQDNLSGYWRGSGIGEDHPHIGTSLALLFLAKGRRPVLIAKLKHDPPDDWNHHRSDLANLTTYVEQHWKRDLTWQVIDPAAAGVDDLLQSPVLFLNGKHAPQFSDEQKRNLRDYVDRGGFIFAEACCGGTEFDTGFRKLMAEIFSEPEYKLRLLPPEHPVWHAEEPVDPQFVRPLWGIDVGCRTSVVYCPQDLSCYWELARVNRERALPARIQAEAAAAEAIGINVLAYATNRDLKFKYEVAVGNDAGDAADPFDRGKLYVGKLIHPGGCNTAPGALPNLLRVAADKLKIRVNTEPREVGLTDKSIFNYHLVFMHGRHQFRLTDAERKQLRTYLERGGMLFADAVCSSEEFNTAFRAEMKAIFPEQPLTRIPPKHAMFTRELGGEDLATVGLRQPERGEEGGPMRTAVRQIAPAFEGIKLGDRYAVVFSHYDVSCALENHESLEFEGYIRADAARLGLNVLLYSLHQ